MVKKLVSAIEPGYYAAPLLPCSSSGIVAACVWSFSVGVLVGVKIAFYFAN